MTLIEDDIKEQYFAGMERHEIQGLLPSTILIYEKAIIALNVLSEDHINNYWREWKELSQYHRTNGRYTRIGPSTKNSNNNEVNSKSIAWNFYSIPRKGKTLFPTFIKKGASNKYARKSVIKYAQSWEIPLFDQYEQTFSEIRKLQILVNQLRTKSKRAHTLIINLLYPDVDKGNLDLY